MSYSLVRDSDCSLLPEIEQALIEWFDPKLNNSEIVLPESRKQRMSLYLTPSLKEYLEKLAKTESRTISNMVEVLSQQAVTEAKKN